MASPHRLPDGSVTFLFSDIEGSTALLHQLGDAGYADALAAHRDVMRRAFNDHQGAEVDTQGDAFFVAFSRASDAIAAALEAQRAHLGGPIRVRMGIHSGEPILTDDGYVGLDVHRAARICSAAHGGQVLLSEATFGLARDHVEPGLLMRAMGERRLKDLTRPEPLYQLVAADLPDTFPPLKALDSVGHNLPVQPTSFIGREAELATTIRLLGKHRLVTLTGTGGTGKTRLSIQVAAELLEQFPAGMWFVDLAPITDAALVAAEVAAALGLREEPGRPVLETLLDFVGSRRLLLILDNCEQVVAGCASVVDRLLRSGPGVRVLATSREPLGVPGEATYRVPSLALPSADPSDATQDHDPLRYEAVQLFVERARAIRPDLALTPASLRTVARICGRLDGIPLAIELAAARTRGMSLDEISDRLDDRFRLLTGGARTALPRQQTLRALVDWSYDILDPAECLLFQRLSVFAGGWTIEAAEAVCAANDLDRDNVLDLVLRLVDKSLVVADERNGVTRYHMLETLREYASWRLEGSGDGEAQRVRLRHLDYFIELITAAVGDGGAPTESGALDERIRAELDNFRASFATSLALAPDRSVELAGRVSYLWVERGLLTEGDLSLERGLAAVPEAPPAARARALRGRGTIAWRRSRYAEAERFLHEALCLGRETPETLQVAPTLTVLGIVLWEEGRLEESTNALEEAVELRRQEGNPWLISIALSNLGLVAISRGQYRQALEHLHEAVDMARPLGAEHTVANMLNNIAVAAEALGDLDAAREAALESVDLFRRSSDRFYLGIGLITLASIEGKVRDFAAMRQHLRESLPMLIEREAQRGIAYALEAAAVALLAADDASASIRMLGAAAALREAIGSPLTTDESDEVGATLSRARAVLDPDAADAAWRAGLALTGGQGAAEAQALLADT